MADKSFVVKAFTEWKEAKTNIKETPTLKGKDFTGWSLETTGSLIPDSHEFIFDTNIYPQYQTSYVQINLNLGPGISSTTYIRIQKDTTWERNKESFNISITYIGYQLKHWSLTQNGTPIPDDYTFTQNLTIYAVYEVRNVYIYLHSSFQLPQEYLVVQQGTTYGEIKNQINISEEGYIFSGWSLTGNGYAISDTYQFLDDTNLYALINYDTRVTVRLYLDNTPGASYIDVLAEEGWSLTQVLQSIEEPTKPGHSLYGWSPTTNPGSTIDPSLTLVYDDTVFYAIWAFNLVIQFQNDYPGIISSSGIFGTYQCLSGETVQDLLDTVRRSSNWSKIHEFGSLNLLETIFKGTTALTLDHVLINTDTPLSIRVQIKDATYTVQANYADALGPDETPEPVTFTLSSITTINEIWDTFLSKAQSGYDHYGTVLGLDFPDTFKNVPGGMIPLYTDGKYLNFNTLNNRLVNFNTCLITIFSVAVKGNQTITLHRGWKYPSAVQVQGTYDPWTLMSNLTLRKKISQVIENDKQPPVDFPEYLVDVYQSQVQCHDGETSEDEDGEYWDTLSLYPQDSDYTYIGERFYSSTIGQRGYYLRPYFHVVFYSVPYDMDEYVVEFIYNQNNGNKYRSIAFNASFQEDKNVEYDGFGINIHFYINALTFYTHTSPLNGINKAAAVILRDPETLEALELIQLDTVKMADIYGVEEETITIQNRSYTLKDFQMVIFME